MSTAILLLVIYLMIAAITVWCHDGK